jgi:hypothetical protein
MSTRREAPGGAVTADTVIPHIHGRASGGDPVDRRSVLAGGFAMKFVLSLALLFTLVAPPEPASVPIFGPPHRSEDVVPGPED